MPATAYLGLNYPSLSAAPNVPQDIQMLAGNIDFKIGGVILCTSSTRPPGRHGATIYETDTSRYMRHDGTTWQYMLSATSTSYTPTWEGSVSNPALGNGTLNGSWVRISARLCWLRIYLLAGSSTTFGSGRWQFSLPVAAGSEQTLAALVNDQSTANRYGGSAYVTTGTGILAVSVGGGGNIGVSSSVPMAWASGDTLTITGIYETA